MDDKFLKPYDPKAVEEKIYQRWEESGFFNPDICVEKGVTKADAPHFSMVLPPPNVTGVLHLGHAFEQGVQDTIIRFYRMRGKKTLWLPGTDHAAIATQEKVEKILYKEEEKTRHDLGREAFLKKVNEFALASHDTIINQTKRLGGSLDWSREAYTLDEKRNLAVRTAIKRMYDDGLIYRGDRIVNWDPKLQTTVSDFEVVYKEGAGNFYYLKYGPFIIGTSRPETKFGDKYVVMHPDDPRYKQYEHGQTIELEWINGPTKATIIKDEAIDMEFGTGVMTITPWHDKIDFEIAERHNLDKEPIIDLKGKLLPIAGEFAGMHISKARPLIIEKLASKGLVEKVEENYTHKVVTNDRGGGIIEPQIIKQWWVDMNKPFTIKDSKLANIPSGSTTSLKDILLKTVESEQITILPENFKKIYLNWVNNIEDWCISRQLWFGHRIPVWYKDEHVFCDVNPPEEDGWEQDPDTLDTWFSSALWTFSTLGWPKTTRDLQTYHPTSLINPGYEILPLWVVRMIFMSGYHLGEIPFDTALIHGIVRDKQGRKFSKSLGNGIDPIEMIEKYGADALRMALIVGVTPGGDSRFEEEKVKAYKKFSNKIWNITRFVLSSLPSDFSLDATPVLSIEDQSTLSESATLLKEITEDMEAYRLHLASEKLYHYVWHTYADVLIEKNKSRLSGENAGEKMATAFVLYSILLDMLKALHPFMPFITEEIWQSLPHKNSDMLIVSPWPRS
jgi:valyl-tRNA synthetase